MPLAPRAAATIGRRVVVTWLVAFAGLFLIGAAWSVATPYDGPPDELQHVLRAYGVIDGQLISPGGRQYVPQSLDPPGIGCFRWATKQPASCAARAGSVPGSEHRFVRVKTAAVFYSPAYYYVCGWPVYFWPDFKGIIAARLLTTTFMALFLASAFAVAAGMRHGRRLLCGLLVALTPVTLDLAGGVNPAGPEIAVAVALWVALIAVVDAEHTNPRLLALAGVSAGALAVLRGFGLGWLFGILCVAALGLSRERVRALSRSRMFWAASALVTGGVGLGMFWRQVVPALTLDDGTTPAGGLSLIQVIAEVLFDRLPYYAQGMVGLTSYGDVPQPMIYVYAWFIAAGCTTLFGLACLGWRGRLRLAVIVLGSYAVLVIPDINAIHHGWYLSQGRYALPFIAGAPLLAGYLLGKSGALADRRLDQLARGCAVLLLPFEVIAMWFTMIRFTKGVQPTIYPTALTPFNGRWVPPEGVLLPLVLCTAGSLVVMVFLFWQSGFSWREGRFGARRPQVIGRSPEVVSVTEYIG